MRILIVDDEKNIRMALASAVESIGNTTVTLASTGAAALKEFTSIAFDIVLLDLRLSQENGLDLMEEMLRISPRLAVILVTANSSIETAVEAMRRGAFDYVSKPCTPEQIRHVIGRVKTTRKLENRVAELESQIGSESPEIDLTTKSSILQKVLDVAFKAAESEASILILGETGTGKSVLAHAIHKRSPRASSAFITVSCPSLSRDLLESELFGHAKGAFTGAHTDTIGKVASADGGTLFLDEIGELPLEIQSRLLRLLQEREYERVGETKSHRSNVRVIAATNRNLKEEVAAGKFREDLYYRLNVISFTLPPLREHIDDLENLATVHLKNFSAHSGKKAKSLSPLALDQMQKYHWPGNLRELRNILERAVILSDGEQITSTDLIEKIQDSSEVRIGGKTTLDEIKNEHIRRVIESSKTLKEAAEHLGIDSATLYRIRAKHN